MKGWLSTGGSKKARKTEFNRMNGMRRKRLNSSKERHEVTKGTESTKKMEIGSMLH